MGPSRHCKKRWERGSSQPGLATRFSGLAAQVVGTAALLLVLAPNPVSADECESTCDGETACEITLVDCLLGADRARDAIEHLKPLVKEYPERPEFARLLAKAYLNTGNSFWALRTLQEAYDRQPDDCKTRSWLAWVYVSQGDFDLAREVLARPGCPQLPAEQARWDLISGFMANSKDDPAVAAEMFRQASAVGRLYPEDKGLWRFMHSSTQPGWIEPLAFHLLMSGGYTSNAMAGSPTDPSTSGPSSLLARTDLFGRLVWPAARAFRPTLELGLKGHGIQEAEARDLSYLTFSARPGIILGGTFPRLLLGYKADTLLLQMEEKRHFYEGHRAEVELETRKMTFFAGAGRRLFIESGRTRWEVDGGLGGGFGITRRVRLLYALSLRAYDAVGEAYDLIGGTALAVGRIGLWSNSYARISVSAGVDDYPHSGGERGALAHGTEEKRRDLMGRFSLGVWSPSWHRLRFGLSYEPSWRDSTADEPTANYDYTEHRILASLSMSFDANPWAPRVVRPDNHVVLDYGLEARSGSSLDQERIQDLLRQDEAARRGSSCVE